MADNYLGFRFNGENIGLESGDDYVGFIINSGDDLKFSSSPEFSNEFASPTLGDNAIYTGTTVSSRTFNFRVALKENTFADFQAVLKWLDKEATGYLIFDYNDTFGYMVKIASIGEASYVAQYDGVTYNIEFDISFVTTGDWAAYELDTDTSATDPQLFTYDQSDTTLQNNSSFEYQWQTSSAFPHFTYKNKSQLNQSVIISYSSILKISNTETTYRNIDSILSSTGNTITSVVNGYFVGMSAGDRIYIVGCSINPSAFHAEIISIDVTNTTIVVNQTLVDESKIITFILLSNYILDSDNSGTDNLKYYSKNGFVLNETENNFQALAVVEAIEISPEETKNFYTYGNVTGIEIEILSREII